MAGLHPMREPLFAEGQLIGYAEVNWLPDELGQVRLQVRFVRCWVGWWHALALSIDRPLPPARP